MSSSSYMLFDEAGLETLFKEQFKPLCAYCKARFGFEVDEAKEVVHLGFIKLWETRDRISPGLSVKAYLYKIVENVSLDVLKHEKVKEKYSKYVSQTNFISITDTHYMGSEFKQLSSDIDKAISDLPEQMRRVFELSRFEGCKYAEIADRLSISVKTVETQMSRALFRLREKLAHYLTIILIAILSR
ncbi:MAG TPA: RNA polymerase sigma-70 factor [Flavitalea sp.]|nr:RNA polymerase sigma-70 factor [Flavitalea sp.]